MKHLANVLLLMMVAAWQTDVTLANLYLTAVSINTYENWDTRPLRGFRRGDLWEPPVRGENILACGSLGTEEYPGIRMPVERGGWFVVCTCVVGINVVLLFVLVPTDNLNARTRNGHACR